MFIIVMIINRIEIPNIERKIILFYFFASFRFFDEKKIMTKTGGADKLSLRVLNKGRASGFPPYGGNPSGSIE